MLKFRLFCIVFILGYFSTILCFKCEFQNFDFVDTVNRHFCSIIPDSSEIIQDHLPENVTVIEYIGSEHESVDFTNLEYPICDKFLNLLRIYISKVKSVDENIFKICKKVEYIVISDTDMEEIPETFYSENLQLYQIILKRNKFTTLPENIFSHINDLKYINLDHNQITSLPLNIFKSLSKLERLYLSFNKIQTLHHDWFNDLPALEGLTLDHNEISDLPKNIFSPLVKLDMLYLSYNNLTVIHSDSFSVHRNLSDCSLNNNKIEAIDEKLFNITPLENTSIFDLDDNVCIDKALYNEGESFRRELKACFENYRPRE